MRKRRWLARSHVGEQDAALLHHRISLLANVGAEVGALRLSRRLEALAALVEQPAVEWATQPAAFEAAVGQISAAVRTGAVDQSVAALVVAENHQILAHQLDRLHRTLRVEFIDQSGGL